MEGGGGDDRLSPPGSAGRMNIGLPGGGGDRLSPPNWSDGLPNAVVVSVGRGSMSPFFGTPPTYGD